uniref:Uncharacterized protein n=1 Tax=Anguilla anguilla TaxID=7936 RepID=A0A0E9RSV9_ANGAN
MHLTEMICVFSPTLPFISECYIGSINKTIV